MTLSVDDRLALHDLVARYAALVDARDFTAVGELFTPDAVLRTPAPPSELMPVVTLQGRPAIAAELSRLEGFTSTVHGLLGAVFDPVDDDPDRARGLLTGIAHHVSSTESGPRDLVWHLRYHDSYLRGAGGWRLTERAINIVTIEVRTLKRA